MSGWHIHTQAHTYTETSVHVSKHTYRSANTYKHIIHEPVTGIHLTMFLSHFTLRKVLGNTGTFIHNTTSISVHLAAWPVKLISLLQKVDANRITCSVSSVPQQTLRQTQVHIHKHTHRNTHTHTHKPICAWQDWTASHHYRDTLVRPKFTDQT